MKPINFCRKQRMFKKMEEQDLQDKDISTSRSDEKTTIPPVLDAEAFDSQTYCTHHPYFWERMRDDLLILRDVLDRENERRIQRAFENAFVEFDMGNEENTSMKILKVEDDDSMIAKLGTNNNKKEKEEQDGDEECDDIMILSDDEINELAPSFIDPQQHDWISEIRSSYKPCNLCLRDYGPEE